MVIMLPQKGGEGSSGSCPLFLASTALLAASALAAATIMLGVGAAQAQTTQGVSKNEIVIGSIQDVSGPIAMLGRCRSAVSSSPRP